MTRIAAWAAVGCAAVAAVAPAQSPPPGFTRTELVNNATVLVARLRLEPGAREPVHTHPFSAVVLQLTPGDVDMTIGDEHTRASRAAGFVWFIPKGAPHAGVNVGTSAYEWITVAIKPDRPPATPGAATAARPGITRTPVIDNDETRVVRVQFAPDGREPTHTHPNDLVTVQLTTGRVEIVEGGARTVEERAPGYVRFLAREVPHSYASADTKLFEIVSVTVK